MRMLIFALMGLIGGMPVALAETPTIFIVDGTAQMSMKLGAQRKIDWLKAAIPQALKRQGPSASAGLWAFGTNSAAKCDDARELVALQAVSAAKPAIEAALASIEPKAGRAPALAAVRGALKAQKDQNAAISLVMIAGAGDDCGGNICDAARALQAIYPKAKLTVFGIDMQGPASEAFSCAAKVMGGTYVPVKTGTDLDRGLQQVLDGPGNVAVAKATTPATPSPSPQSGKAPIKDGKEPQNAAPAESAPAAPVAPPPPPVEPNVSLSATLGSGPVLQTGVTWKIYRPLPAGEAQPSHPNPPIWTTGGGAAQTKLGEGHYRVEVAYGLARTVGEIDVGKDKLYKIFPLDAGMIAAEAFTAATPAQRLDDTFFTLYKAAVDGQREEVGRSSALPAMFYVPSGDYILQAVSGLAKLETPVKVVSGKVSKVAIALNVGTLNLKTAVTGQIPPTLGVWHAIYPAQRGASERPVRIVTQAEATLRLPAGAYRIETSLGAAKASTLVSIAAGQTATPVIALNLGEAKINVASAAAPNANAAATDLTCALYTANGGKKGDPLARAAGGDIRFWVPDGTYDVECKKTSDAKSVAKQAQISVVSGRSQNVDLAP